MNWTSPTHHHYQDHPKEHALPDGEQTPPHTGTGTSTGTGTGTGADTGAGTGTDAPVACTCTCGHGNPTEQRSTAHTHAEQASLLIAKTRQKKLEADELAEQQRLFLAHPPRWVHYIGPTPRAWPADDRTDEEHNAEVQAYIDSFESYEDYKAADRTLNARINPALYAIQIANDYKLAHPDPNKPPF